MEDALIDTTCGVVLAGGKSRRMGVEKPFILLGGKTLIQRVTGILSSIFSEVIIVVENPASVARYSSLPFPVLHDRFLNKGPMGGVEAALNAAKGKHIFVTAVDMPFLNPLVIRSMIAAYSDSYDVVIPDLSGRLHPLHAFYTQACQSEIVAHLKTNRLALHRLRNHLRCYFFSEAMFRACDPDLRSLININTPEGLTKAQGLIDQEKR